MDNAVCTFNLHHPQ
uniref:(California timema) hypothetical protein n=1 Tax=Timema californicum TaxID=61474 RepID=A0A7R9JKY4_TIMCA|nr:unnamed protein product [Timema californicum]